MEKVNILLVEDNEVIIMGLKYSLEQEGYSVVATKNAKEAIEQIKKEIFTLYLLDISLPDGNGFEICRYIKEKGDFPVIFLTAREEETNVVIGLDMGADDYIIKPFRNRELISRIKNVLRRYEKINKIQNKIEQNNNEKIYIKNIVIDKEAGRVYKNKKEIIFTSLEYRILVMLFSNLDKLITREQLLDRIWDVAGNFVNDNTLTVYIKRIREKLEDKDGKIIETIRGIGYRVASK